MESVNKSLVVVLLFVLCSILPLANGEIELEDGKFFIITSVSSGRAMTVQGPNFSKGASVVTSPWIARDTQTWLALKESEQTQKEGRTVGGPQKYVLIPQKQNWDWKTYVNNGVVNLTVDTLPQNTMVLTLDSSAVNLTQEAYTNESSQKWVTEEAANGEVLIKNWGNLQCIRNFDHRNLNFLENLRKRIDNFFGVFRKRKPFPLGTLTCDAEDITERWTLEPAFILNFRRI